VLGRTVPPWLSDRVLGPLNATIAMNVFTLAVVLVLWLPLGASSVTALFVVVVLMGIGTGSFVPLGGKWCPLVASKGQCTDMQPKVSCINALCRPENMGTWLGSAYSLVSFAYVRP
jgi:dipeptide/tripeptide permease